MPAVVPTPSKGLVLFLAIAMVAFVILAEVFTRLDEKKRERDQPERDRALARLVAITIKENEARERREAESVGRSKVFDSAEGLEPPLGPRIFMNVRSHIDGPYTKTDFLLTNSGGGVAHNIRVEPIRLSSGNIEFPGVETLERGITKELQPTVSRTSAASKNNLSSLLFGEWDRLKDRKEEMGLPMRILYQDSFHNRFVTDFLLVYMPMQDILEQAAFKVRKAKFSPLAPSVA
jgi:hypothetical protein